MRGRILHEPLRHSVLLPVKTGEAGLMMLPSARRFPSILHTSAPGSSRTPFSLVRATAAGNTSKETNHARTKGLEPRSNATEVHAAGKTGVPREEFGFDALRFARESLLFSPLFVFPLGGLS
jgi:hypothetical protein